MFWDAPWDGDAVAASCLDQYGVPSDRLHFVNVYGNPYDWKENTSNIFWSQGEYDPWRGGGVQEDLSETLKATVIGEAAHHLDLFFGREGDTEQVKECRRMEVEEIWRWVEEKRSS